jgi:hypothetical protein
MRTWLKVTFRRYWPAKQDAVCLNGHSIRGERYRHPCPTCGTSSRSVSRTATESLGAADKAT